MDQVAAGPAVTAGAAGRRAELPQSRITDEMIERMRQLAGTELRIDHSTSNEIATRHAIIRFAEGIGDPNPLWSDREYAEQTHFGGVVAPPSWVLCCFAGLQFGWPGLGSFHNATDLEFLRPIRLGDAIRASCTYEGFSGPRPSRFAKVAVVDHFRNEYVNQDDELVARVRWSVYNYERSETTARSDRPAPQLPHPWSEEEAKAIEATVLAEQARGGTSREWQAIREGDELETIVKGPIGMTDEIAFVSCGAAPIPRLAAHGVALRLYEKHPDWAFRDPTTGALEPIYAVHYNQLAAKAMGVELQYDVGFQRQCWQVHLLTNWAGDTGWVKQASAQYRGFVYHSDVVTLGGTVKRKFVDDRGDCCIEVATWAKNQRGDDVMPGRAVIAIPGSDGSLPAALR